MTGANAPSIIPQLTDRLAAPELAECVCCGELAPVARVLNGDALLCSACASAPCRGCGELKPLVSVNGDLHCFCATCATQDLQKCDGCGCYSTDLRGPDYGPNWCEWCRETAGEVCPRHPDTRSGYGI